MMQKWVLSLRQKNIIFMELEDKGIVFVVIVV